MADEETGEFCRKCGVKVAPGYPTCPKCKAVLTAARSGSGTAVTGQRVSLSLVLVVAVATAGVSYVANRDDPDPKGDAIPLVAAGEAGDQAADEGAADEGAADEGAGSTEQEDEDTQPNQELLDALQELEASLQKNGVRVWADVEPGKQDVLILRTADCEEIENQVSSFSEDISKRFKSLRCLGRLGAVDFESKL